MKGDILFFAVVFFMCYVLFKLWDAEKKIRIDREKQIENMYNEIMGKNEK